MLARLQLSEPAVARQRPEFKLAGIAEYCRRDRAAEVHVEAAPAALGTELCEAGQRITASRRSTCPRARTAASVGPSGASRLRQRRT